MKFKVYKRITATYCKEIKHGHIFSMRALRKIFDKYGHEDEPLKVYFNDINGHYIIIE